MRGGRSTSGACHAGRAMKAAPDLHKKRAERGGRKREGGESERRAGKGTTTQPSAGGTAQSTDLRGCTPLQDQYAKAHRRSRSKAAHPPARFGPAASPRVARGAAKAVAVEVAPTFAGALFKAGVSCPLVHGRAARRGVPHQPPKNLALLSGHYPGANALKIGAERLGFILRPRALKISRNP